MSSSTCKTKIQHRKRKSERLVQVQVTALSDELELVEIRYQAYRARMALEQLFSEGFSQ